MDDFQFKPDSQESFADLLGDLMDQEEGDHDLAIGSHFMEVDNNAPVANLPVLNVDAGDNDPPDSNIIALTVALGLGATEARRVRSNINTALSMQFGFIPLSEEFPTFEQWRELLRYIHFVRDPLGWYKCTNQTYAAREEFRVLCLSWEYEEFHRFRENRVSGESIKKHALTEKDNAELAAMVEFYTILQTMLWLMPKETWLAMKPGASSGVTKFASALESRGSSATPTGGEWRRRMQIVSHVFFGVPRVVKKRKFTRKSISAETEVADIPVKGDSDSRESGGELLDAYIASPVQAKEASVLVEEDGVPAMLLPDPLPQPPPAAIALVAGPVEPITFPDTHTAEKEWFRAAVKGDPGKLRRIWESCAAPDPDSRPWALDLHCQDRDSKTVLIKAASSGDTPGHIEAVRYLMQLGAQTNPADPGAFTNYQDPNGGHALYYACCFDYVGVIGALLASPDTGLNLRQGYGTTSLMMAASNGQLPALQTVLTMTDTGRLDVNALMNGGKTALILAVIGAGSEETQEQMVTALLQAGADATIATEGGYTAFLYACLYGKINLAQVLRAHQLAPEAGEFDILSVPAGVDITLMAAPTQGQFLRALVYAAFCGQEMLLGATLDWLLRHHSRAEATMWVNTACHQGVSILAALVRMEYSQPPNAAGIVSLLLSAGADANVMEKGETALMVAAKRGRIGVMEALLQHGADMNVLTESGGNCALYFACVEGQRAAVELLLEHGAVKHSNHSGHSLYDVATKAGFDDIADLVGIR